MGEAILTTKTFIDKLNLLNNYDDTFIIKYYLTTISYGFGRDYLITKGFNFDESYEEMSEFKDIINEITSISFDEFKNIYTFNKPLFKDKEKTKDNTTLKGYINSKDFTIFKFMFLKKSIKRYILLLFNSKKSIEFLNKDVSMISYNFDNFNSDNEFHQIHDFNMNSLFPILILNALKSNKFISMINDQFLSIKILEKKKEKSNSPVSPTSPVSPVSPISPNSRKRKKSTNFENLNLFCFLKTSKHINTIIQIISKMYNIHSKFNNENNIKYSKYKIIKNPFFSPGFKAFSKFQISNEDIKDIIGPYLYKYYDSFIKSEEIREKLLKLLKTIKNIRNYPFFKIQLKELDKTINKEREINNIPNTFEGDYGGQQEAAEAYNNWFEPYLFIETIIIKNEYNDLKIKSYSVTDNSSSNKHLKKIIKNTRLNRIENLPLDHILIR